MQAISDRITAFLHAHHVLNVAVQDVDGLWAASCFYVFDAAAASLIILSSTQTRHGKAMLRQPQIAGAISGQPTELKAIQGVQFAAHAALLDGPERACAHALYLQRHPLARGHTDAEVWRLSLDLLKFTDNSEQFGHKTEWRRADAA